jgi:hypothetical protein
VAVAALGLDEQTAAVVRAQAARVLEQNLRLALRHFAQDDDEVGVVLQAG